jgi:hypothetical protein
MPAPSFRDLLNTTLNAGGTTEFLRAFDMLRKIAADLTLWLRTNPDDGVLVQVEPGFPAKIGQQFNMVVRIPAKGVADTLFRAYVDTSGKVSLDFFGDEAVICKDETELQAKVLEFLGRAEVNARMNVYKQLAT